MPATEFRAHIEAQFTSPGNAGMTWENHGACKVNGPRVWHIDHVVPIKYQEVPGVAPTLEEVAARLHWTNTQPMWADENIAKGNRYVGRAGDEEGLPATPEPQIESCLTDDELSEVFAQFGL